MSTTRYADSPSLNRADHLVCLDTTRDVRQIELYSKSLIIHTRSLRTEI